MSLFVSFTVTPMLARPEVTEVFSSVVAVTGSISGTSNNSYLAEVTVTLNDKKEAEFHCFRVWGEYSKTAQRCFARCKDHRSRHLHFRGR